MKPSRSIFTYPRYAPAQPPLHLILAIAVGIGIGFIGLYASTVDPKWVLVIFLAIIAPSIVLVVNDIHKILLVVFVIDIPIGIDIALQNRVMFEGEVTGYTISLMTLALIVGYALWLIERKPRPRFMPQIMVPALLLLFMSLFSLTQSPDWQVSTFSLFLKCQVILMLFYLINHIDSWDKVRLIVITSIICMLLESALMMLQYFTGATLNVGNLITSQSLAEDIGGAGVTGARVSGTFPDPGSAALYLNTVLPIAFGIYLIGKGTERNLALIALPLGIISLVATSSRAGWISFAIAMTILLIRSMRTEFGQKALGIILIGILLVGILFGAQILQRVSTLTEDETRQQLATTTYNMIRAYPLGVGDNAYTLRMSMKYAHPDLESDDLSQPHNTYLITWTELSILGLIAFVWLILAAFWQSRSWFLNTEAPQNLVILGAGYLSGLVAFSIHMLSESFHAHQQYISLWFIIAMLVVISQLAAQNESVETVTEETS